MKTTFLKGKLCKFLTLILFLHSSNFIEAQNLDTKGTFKFGNPTQLPQCTFTGEVADKAKKEDINEGILFEIVNKNSVGYVIHIFKMSFKEKINGAKQLTEESTSFNEKYSIKDGKSIYFLLSFADYESAKVYKLRNLASFTVGAASSIVKLRPGIKSTFNSQSPIYFDYGNDFTLGLLVGYKQYYSRNPNKTFASNFLLGLGTTSISVDSTKTKGYVKSTYTLQGVYLSFGHVLEYQKFQIGFFMGVDYLTGAVGRSWIYRDRPWFGISLGYSIFKTNTQSQLENNNDTNRGR